MKPEVWIKGAYIHFKTSEGEFRKRRNSKKGVVMEYLIAKNDYDLDLDREQHSELYARLDKLYTPSSKKIQELEKSIITDARKTLKGETEIAAFLTKKLAS